jgi:alkylation response protein AidB-like acyl-CoA dehydrogenase
MDLALNDEQLLIKDSVERFVLNDYSFDQRKKCVAEAPGYSEENWAMFAELGWLAIPFSEEDGGLDGTAIESMVVFEQFGRAIVVEPFIPTVVLAGGAIRLGGSSEQRKRYLPALIEGKLQGALAFVEPQGRFDLHDLTTTATAKGDGFVINGYKAVVLNAPAADFLVVSARTSGAQRDSDGVSLFVLDAKQAGISRHDFTTVDALRASEITFENVEVGADALLGEAGKGLEVLQQVIDEGTFAVCAEAVGCMEVLYKDTVEYSKVREQFGQRIGSFQALQHRMVDMFMAYEQSKSMLYMTAAYLEKGYDEEAQKYIAALKVQIGKAGKLVGQDAIQIHGGMGLTDELSTTHYFKRVTVIENMFGNSRFHLKRFAALAG